MERRSHISLNGQIIYRDVNKDGTSPKANMATKMAQISEKPYWISYWILQIAVDLVKVYFWTWKYLRLKR